MLRMMMTWKYLKYPISLGFFVVFATGCFQSDYTKLVKSELAKGVRQDSLILGIKFGDTRLEFQGKCFDLNQQQLVTAGTNGFVQYQFVDSLVHQQPTQIKLQFSPTFDQNEIIDELNLEFGYVSWAPWNRKYQSDSLLVKTKKIIMGWYGGNDFINVLVDKRDTPVKLDCNRRILISIKDEQTVAVKIQDILHPRFRHSTSSADKKE